MKNMIFKYLLALLPMLLLLTQLGYAIHCHSLNSYHDGNDGFDSPSVQCTLGQIDTQSAGLNNQAEFVPAILISIIVPIETPSLTDRRHSSLLPPRAPPA